jgi:hypothetical protein
MDCKESRREFYNKALAGGWLTVKDIPEIFQPDIPKELKVKWLKLLTRTLTPKLQETPRLLNHFTLGADPEFVLYEPRNGVRLDGAALGLRTGQAFGVDSNGRLLEIRPKPTRWALELLASTLVTMRWLALCKPETMSYEWRAGAFLLRDGLGGHVHIGRKADSRSDEVRALDVLSDMLTALGVYPAAEVAARRAGDQFNQRYGQPGDIRLQTHGYEYRTFPSWLDSPWIAYLSIVLSKLLVYDPDVFKEFQVGNQTPQLARQRITSLLAKWQGLDDDALLALHVLRSRGFPVHAGGDFKSRWGIRYAAESKVKLEVVPKQIQPTKDEVLQLFCHFLRGTELMPDVPQAYWVTKLPKGYLTVLGYTETQRIAGLGELLNELVVSDSCVIGFYPAESASLMRVSTGLAKQLGKGWMARTGLAPTEVAMESTAQIRISFSTRGRGLEGAGKVRKALVSGEFPIWEAKDVKATSWEQWKTRTAGGSEAKTPAKVLVKVE